jgi:Dolichyl-phosphate-mannose-protein mannosyltransferase
MQHLTLSHPAKVSSRQTRLLLSDPQLAAGYLVITSLIYFGFAFYFAISRAFWYDELFTFYVASLPDPATIWRSLLGGMDNHPPLDYLIRHYSMLLLGHSEFGARLPSIVAFYGAFLCVFFYGRAAHSTLAGVIASSLLLGAPAAMYAVEGRGYALLLGFGAAALLLWRRLSMDERAPVWMWVALGACLAGSVWTHYYGLLTIAAFCIAGLVDWIQRGRVPVKLLVTGIVVGVASVPVAPFALGAKGYGTHFWAVPEPYPIQAFHEAVGNLGAPGVEVFLLVALCALLLRRAPPARWFVARWSAQPGFSASEIALLVAVQFGPVMQWVLARQVTHAYNWYYTIASIAAECVAGGILLACSCARNSTVVLAVCCLLCFLQAPSSLRRLKAERDTRREVLSMAAAIDARMASSPNALVAPHAITYLAYYHYGSDRVKKNLVMLSDPEAAVRLGRTDTDEIALQHLAKFLPIRFEPFAAFTSKHSCIDLTTGRYDKEIWIVPRLLEAGYQVSLPPSPVKGIMYHCERR